MEKWIDIEGYEGIYAVSNYGKVKNLKTGYIFKQRLTFDGYVKATLTTDGKARDFTVHRLVAKAFIPNPSNKETVNHKDGVKTNNHEDNLEWATRSEQNIHSYKLQLKKPMKASLNPNAKLTDEEIREIRERYVKGSMEFGTVALGRKYGVNASVIERVVKRLSYKSVE